VCILRRKDTFVSSFNSDGSDNQGQADRQDQSDQPGNPLSKALSLVNQFVGGISTLIYAVIIAISIRTFAYEPFNIPSGSMLPTLLVGDYLFVSKSAYGYSRYSIPLGLPLFSGRVFASPVERGDVAVFKKPGDEEIDYIKRIIGVPGDRIQMVDGVLHLNGQAVPRERVEDFAHIDRRGNHVLIPQYRETLPSGPTYMTLDAVKNGSADNTRVFLVPEGYYFAMGDNRDNSLDSRILWGGIGMVPEENMVGRAEFLFFSVNGKARIWELWKWPGSIRYSRLFTAIE